MDPNVAVDAPLQNRPGVPRERLPPEPIAPEPSLTPVYGEVEVLLEPTRAEVTPVFASPQAPHGLSGMMRRAAYRLPDYRVRRWLVLLVADRVDAQEARVADIAKSPVTWIVASFVLVGAAVGWAARTLR